MEKYFKYLWSVITWNGSYAEDKEVEIHLGRQRLVYWEIDIELRNRFAKCFIWSIVTYASENMIGNDRKKDGKCLEGSEMRLRQKKGKD